MSTVAELILLSVEEMRSAEAAAMKAGVSGAGLMETAGAKLAEVAMRAWTERSVVVLCGPGNNGGDGFVAARKLREAGWPVSVGLFGDRGALKGDSKLMADLYEGEIAPASTANLGNAGLIIDALFGTGLSRLIDGEAKALIDAVNAHPAPVLAADIPSGVHADTGAVLGAAVQAARTVTFFQKKTGHLLFPGRAYCAAVDVVDIGITDEHAAQTRPTTFENHPALWGAQLRRPTWQEHKYHRGSVFAVSGGPFNTGAIRLAAMGALRIGAGLVTVLSSEEAARIHAAQLTSIMVRPVKGVSDIADNLTPADKYQVVGIIGPASGVGGDTRNNVLAILKSAAGAVLDADALTSFADDPAMLFSSLRGDDVLTPHSGEFVRLFGDIDPVAGKLAATRAAAKKAGAVVVLKGPDTIVAAPDGRASINVNAPPELATAGSGDVLAGFIAGLRAQGMGGFEAACAGVWFHGAVGQAVGPGLIAEDLPKAVPTVFRSLFAPDERQSEGAPEDAAR